MIKKLLYILIGTPIVFIISVLIAALAGIVALFIIALAIPVVVILLIAFIVINTGDYMSKVINNETE